MKKIQLYLYVQECKKNYKIIFNLLAADSCTRKRSPSLSASLSRSPSVIIQ